ncbi:MAG: thioredoxin [Oscillospiraceae bacterium]|nr:thioredoxin [Oscillospiraceae bacterium]
MKRGTIGALLLALGAVLTAVGCLLGQHSAVMAKAVRVCMECVGIG